MSWQLSGATDPRSGIGDTAQVSWERCPPTGGSCCGPLILVRTDTSELKGRREGPQTIKSAIPL